MTVESGLRPANPRNRRSGLEATTHRPSKGARSPSLTVQRRANAVFASPLIPSAQILEEPRIARRPPMCS